MPKFNSQNINEIFELKNDRVVLACLSEGPKTYNELKKCSFNNNGPRSGFNHVRERLLKKKLIELFLDNKDKQKKYRLTKSGAITYNKQNWPLIDELLELNREYYYYFQDVNNVFSTSTIYDPSALNSLAFIYLPTFSNIPLFIQQIFGTFLLSNSNVDQIPDLNTNQLTGEGEVILFIKINIQKLNTVLSDFKLLINAKDNLDFLSPNPDNHFNISQETEPRNIRITIQMFIDLLVYGSISLSEKEVQERALKIINETIKNTINLHRDKVFSNLDMKILKAVSDFIDLSEDPLNDKDLRKKLIFKNKKNNLVEYPILEYVTASKLLKLDPEYNQKVYDYLEKYPDGFRWRLQRGEI